MNAHKDERIEPASDLPRDEYAYLPPVLSEIAQIAGLPAALALAQLRGGCQVYIPPRARDGHWLVKCVGRNAADAIGEYFGHQRVVIPLGNTRFYARAARRAAQLLSEGLSLHEVARHVGVHTRTVSRVKARMIDGGDDDHGKLF